MAGRPLWPWFAALFGAASLVGVYVYTGGGIAVHPVYIALVSLFGCWLGAFVGGAIDWLRSRRSPLAPMFEGRFAGYYRQGLWLRFALIFALGWLFSVSFAGIFIVIMGSPEEVSALFSVSGLLAVGIMGLVYAVLGAVIGGLITLAGMVFGGK